MPVIKRGTVKSYTPSTHRASAQIAGSLGVWLANIPVATDIPAAEVIAGRECAVLFFTDDNPDDAVVVTVHGAVPAAPGGGGGSKIADTDADTSVNTEASADEDKIRLTVFSTLRGLFQTATPHIQLTGDLQVTGDAAVGALAPNANTYLRAGTGAGVDGMLALEASIGSTAGGAAGSVKGVGGYALAKSASTTSAYGLDYIAGMTGQSITEAAGVQVTMFAAGAGKSIGAAYGIRIKAPTTMLATIGTYIAVKLDDPTNSSGTSRFLQCGADPVLMVKTKKEWTPAANQTGVWIAEGATPTPRQVRWKDGAYIGAGDKVLVLV